MSEQHWSTPIDNPIPGGCNVGCGSCAFRDGSVTRHEPYNAIRAQICALGGVPFYCHRDMDGPVGDEFRGRLPPGIPYTVCEGWKSEVRRRAKLSWWRESLRMRRTIARIALLHFEGFIDSDPKRKKHHLAVFKRALHLLTKKSIRLGAFRNHLMDVRPD
jgi:hypothetical protein